MKTAGPAARREATRVEELNATAAMAVKLIEPASDRAVRGRVTPGGVPVRRELPRSAVGSSAVTDPAPHNCGGREPAVVAAEAAPQRAMSGGVVGGPAGRGGHRAQHDRAGGRPVHVDQNGSGGLARPSARWLRWQFGTGMVASESLPWLRRPGVSPGSALGAWRPYLHSMTRRCWAVSGDEGTQVTAGAPGIERFRPRLTRVGGNTPIVVERSGPAIREALCADAPAEECAQFEEELRSALARAAEDLDLSGPQAVLRHWHALATMAANPPTDDEREQIKRAKAGDFTGLRTRDENGNWVRL